MRQYLVRRLLLIFPTLLLTSMIIFVLIRYVPGDMVDLLADQREGSFAMDAEKIRDRLGLNKPIHLQYLQWLGEIARGNLGESMWSRRGVMEEVVRRFPVTLELAVLTVILSTLWGLLVGVVAAAHQDSPADYLLRTIAIAGLSIPYFWSSILVLVFASIYLNWSPDPIYVPLTEDMGANLMQMLVPAVIFSFYIGAPVARMTRATMLEVLRADYIRTAWAKGLAAKAVIYRHALKNAFISVVTIIGLQAVWAVSGLVLIETIWGLPGIGKYVFDVVVDRDYPMLQGLVLCIAVCVIGINFLVDLSYAWLDPRIRYHE
ncbi:glutathione ABC transporter permease GsiC [Candidatus Entotheonella serta]|nr:glutathione ABC transporter permease GsiC [Candidatus Entotheonella serta]